MNMSMYFGISLALPLLLLDDVADLDAVARPRLRDRDRRVTIGSFDDRKAADRFLRLDERSVDDRDLSGALADGGRGACGLELRPAVDDLRPVDLEPLEDVGVDLLLLRRGVGLVIHAIV